MLAEGAMTSPITALVVCGGGHVQPALLPREATFVVAADQGATEALRLGLRVDFLVGDMDSTPDEVLAEIERKGGYVERHPQDKEHTDLQLALDRAVTERAGRIVVAGGADGRLDHLIGNALLLASPRYERQVIDAVFGAARLHIVRGERTITGAIGELVSLFALGGPAVGVRTTGFKWNLHDEDLQAGSSRGTSNQFAREVATVAVREGVLAAIRPGEEHS
jgi:thiamine pyrophosphokinase